MHGASDGCPGLYVDKLGDWLLAQSETPLTTSEKSLLKEQAFDWGVRGVYHKVLNRQVRMATTVEASPRLLFGDAAPERFTIRENGLNFEISFQEGYSVGIFLDQRDNRRRFLANHVAAAFSLFTHAAHGTEVLNTFAYTCGFGIAAAKAGTRTTNVDLSRKYLAWGKRNFALNGIDAAQHDFIYGDTFDWMRRMAKKGRAFDCIVLDPPTFSHSKEGGRWQASKGFGKLVASALSLLKPGGVFLASTNATKFSAEEFLSAIHAAVAEGRRRVLQQHYSPQPPDFPITSAEPAYLKTAWLRIS
jgi:23S rRNA (cytosine1962-C5)-methyltransferase